MIVGRPERFAIQYEIEKQSDGWLFGEFCYVLNCRLVGKFDEGATLNVAIAGISRLLGDAGNRCDSELMQKAALGVYNQIHAALYSDDGRTDNEIKRDAQTFARFNIGSFIDVFDGWECYLVEQDGIARILCKEAKLESPLIEVVLREGEFDSVCREFLRAIQSQHS